MFNLNKSNFRFISKPAEHLLGLVSGAIKNDKSFSGAEVSNTRILVVIITFALCYLLIAGRVFDLTVLDKKNGKVLYANNSMQKRAEIIDRNGNILAVNLKSSSAYANPKLILNAKEAAIKINKIFPENDVKILEDKLRSNKSFIWIKRNLTPREHQELNNLGIPGVYFETSEKRAYPNAELFSNVLGYVGLDGSGLAGIEKQYNDYLSYNDVQPKPLQLSLDTAVQGIVHEELSKTISEFNAIGGVGIVQDVYTGEILAMVNLPDFNPHNPGMAKPEQLFNKCTLGAYEPGSLFKIFTVAMALENKSTTLSDVYDTRTSIKYARFNINDYRGKGGFQSVPEILMNSSNIGTAQIALEVGKEDHYKYLRSFGLLSPLEIELPEKALPAYPRPEHWSDLSTITISYGHGISVTPLHVINVLSGMANGGIKPKSTLIKVENNEPRDAKRIVSESTSEQVKKLLRLIVTNGSGRKADIPGLFIGGKTGTANKIANGKYSQNMRLSSFMSVFPLHKPRFAVLIMIDEPKGTKETFGFATGGWVSAPITKRIILRLSNLYGIAPETGEKFDEINNKLYVAYNTKDSEL